MRREAVVVSDRRDGLPQEFVALAQQAAAPQLTESALRLRFGLRSGWVPVPGQIWRVTHEDVGLLVLLLEVGAESVVAVPISVESVHAADTLPIDGGGTALGVPVTVWPGLHRGLSVAVLDRPVAEVSAAVVGGVVDWPARSDEPVSDVGRRSDPVVAEARAMLEDDLAALADVLGADVDPPGQEITGEIDFENLSPEAFDDVAERLGVSMQIALDMIDGKRIPTRDQAMIMREVLGGSPTAAALPPGLVTELNQPRWRGLARQRGRRDRITEEAARRALAYDVMAMAARQTGDREPSWPDRIRRWSETHQLDPDAAE
jgi:hypothetical protein